MFINGENMFVNRIKMFTYGESVFINGKINVCKRDIRFSHFFRLITCG